MTEISIIIPILNEAENIEYLLNHLDKNLSKGIQSEIIMVDGGSTDSSKEIISKYKNVILLKSEKGRAKQMNFGAKNASANILYFLHADSFPPNNFDQFIINEIAKKNQAGCFIMKFDSKHWWLKLAGLLTKLPFKACRGGDQSLFVTKSVFDKLGGFDEKFTIYEDNDFISKLYKTNQFVVIQKWLTTSARRYETNGVWRLQYHFLIIHLKKWFGASAENLSNYYRKYIR